MQPQSKIRKKKLKGHQRRDQIIKVAMDVFSKNGFRGTTMQKLARSANISEAMIYQHFSGKNNLYEAIIKKKTESSDKYFIPHLKDTSDYRNTLKKLVDTFLDVHSRDITFIRIILFSALENHELSKRFIQGPLQEYFKELGAFLKESLGEHYNENISPDVAARLLIGMAYYAILLKKIMGDPLSEQTDNKELSEQIVDLFLKGLEEK